MTSVKERQSLTEGALFTKIILYVIPIMLTGILQLLYNTADQIVVGQFSGDPNALAAVGSTSSATNLIVNLTIGISAGAVVVMSQSFGAGNKEMVSRAVHTVVSFSVIAGLVFSVIGFAASRPLLAAIGTKAELLDSATLYMQIIMCGVPASVVYNFASCVFRAKGDSRTPFVILSLSGIANVVLNLVFVILFSMGIAGVAVATVISQYISAAAVIILLFTTKKSYRIDPRKLTLDPVIIKRILLIGIPSGLQGVLFSISNMIVQSSVNPLSTAEVGGNTVGGTIEGYTYTLMNAYYQATITFVGQNFGAGRLDRVKKTLIYSAIQVFVVGFAVGGLETLFIRELSVLFVDMSKANALAIVDAAARRSTIILPLYFLCGWMETLTAYQRGLGSSIRPMIVSLFSVCAFRVIWASLVFPIFGTALSLYIVYPISWAICVILHLVFSIIITRKLIKRNECLQKGD